MARMFPRALDEQAVKSKAEVKVFKALEGGLGDDWDVFHSVSWTVRDAEEGALDGEIDFVLCSPSQGIITVEVKGGASSASTGSGSGSRRAGGSR